MDSIPDISAAELKHRLAAGEDIFLVDVREQEERHAGHIGGIWIPMEEVMRRRAEIPAGGTVVVYCRKGIRSGIVIQRLQEKAGITHLLNLRGGLLAWQRENDTPENRTIL